MNHPNPFHPVDGEEAAKERRPGLHWLVAVKVVIIAAVVIAIVALHVAGIVGLGLHAAR